MENKAEVETKAQRAERLAEYTKKMTALEKDLPTQYKTIEAKYKKSGDALKLAAKERLLEKLKADGQIAITLVDIQVGFTIDGAGLTAPGGDNVILSNIALLDAIIEIQKENPDLAKKIEIVTSQDAHVADRNRKSADSKTMIAAYKSEDTVNEVIDGEELELQKLDGVKKFGFHCLSGTPDVAIAKPIEERLELLEKKGMDVHRFGKINFSGPKAGMLLKKGIKLEDPKFYAENEAIYDDKNPTSYLDFFKGKQYQSIVMTGICGDVCVEEGALGLAEHLKTVEVHDPFVHYLVIKDYGMTYDGEKGKRTGTEAKFKKAGVKYVPYEGFRSNPELMAEPKKEDKKTDSMATRNQVLTQIKFDGFIKELRVKAKHLHNGKKETTASKVADKLVKALETAKTNFRDSKKSDSESLVDFKVACIVAVTAARPELAKHRGFHKYFAKFLSAMASLFTLGIINVVTKKDFFSVVKLKGKTDSAKKLDKLEADLDKEIPTAMVKKGR